MVIDALLGPLRKDSGVPSALSTLDHAGRSWIRGVGPLRDSGRELGSIGGANLDFGSRIFGPGSIEVSRLLDPAPGEVLVVVLELIEEFNPPVSGAKMLFQADFIVFIHMTVQALWIGAEKTDVE